MISDIPKISVVLLVLWGDMASAQPLQWATQAGGTDIEWGTAIDYTADGIFVAGYFSGTATFGGGEPNETLLTSVGDSDVFIAKYESPG